MHTNTVFRTEPFPRPSSENANCHSKNVHSDAISWGSLFHIHSTFYATNIVLIGEWLWKCTGCSNMPELAALCDDGHIYNIVCMDQTISCICLGLRDHRLNWLSICQAQPRISRVFFIFCSTVHCKIWKYYWQIAGLGLGKLYASYQPALVSFQHSIGLQCPYFHTVKPWSCGQTYYAEMTPNLLLLGSQDQCPGTYIYFICFLSFII